SDIRDRTIVPCFWQWVIDDRRLIAKICRYHRYVCRANDDWVLSINDCHPEISDCAITRFVCSNRSNHGRPFLENGGGGRICRERHIRTIIARGDRERYGS